jgi:hypothetical protein
MAQQLMLPGLWQQGHCLRHVVLLQQCHWHVARQLSLSCRQQLAELLGLPNTHCLHLVA